LGAGAEDAEKATQERLTVLGLDAEEDNLVWCDTDNVACGVVCGLMTENHNLTRILKAMRTWAEAADHIS